MAGVSRGFYTLVPCECEDRQMMIDQARTALHLYQSISKMTVATVIQTGKCLHPGPFESRYTISFEDFDCVYNVKHDSAVPGDGPNFIKSVDCKDRRVSFEHSGTIPWLITFWSEKNEYRSWKAEIVGREGQQQRIIIVGFDKEGRLQSCWKTHPMTDNCVLLFDSSGEVMDSFCAEYTHKWVVDGVINPL
jgi:hypothetical protein